VLELTGMGDEQKPERRKRYPWRRLVLVGGMAAVLGLLGGEACRELFAPRIPWSGWSGGAWENSVFVDADLTPEWIVYTGKVAGALLGWLLAVLIYRHSQNQHIVGDQHD
jgi:hypothetical protein